MLNAVTTVTAAKACTVLDTFAGRATDRALYAIKDAV